MRLLLTSGSFHALPGQKTFSLAKEAGFDGINLMITKEFLGVDEVSLVRDLQKILPIDSVHVPFIALWGWGNPIEKIERTVRLAIETGIPLVNFHPPGWLLMEIGFSAWFLGIRDFQKEVGKGKVTISIENMPRLVRYLCDPHLLSRTGNLRRFLLEKNLHLTFDSSHMGTKKTDFLDDFASLYKTDRIRQVQYSDYQDGREHLRPGSGCLPLPALLRFLVKENYSEGLCLELMQEEFPDEEKTIIAMLKEILEKMREMVGTQK